MQLKLTISYKLLDLIFTIFIFKSHKCSPVIVILISIFCSNELSFLQLLIVITNFELDCYFVTDQKSCYSQIIHLFHKCLWFQLLNFIRKIFINFEILVFDIYSTQRTSTLTCENLIHALNTKSMFTRKANRFDHYIITNWAIAINFRRFRSLLDFIFFSIFILTFLSLFKKHFVICL